MLQRIVHWPFFGESERDFASDFESWVSRQPPGDENDADGSCRRWVHTLAEGGWLAFCVELEVRKLALAREALAYRDALGDFAFAMQGLGAGPIALFGSKEQRQTLLPEIVSGEAIMAFALSESEAGSDVSAITTRARRDAESYVIDGEKTWISNAGIADRYVVFARTSDEGSRGLSAFVVDANTPGLSIARRIETISPHPLGTLRFDAVSVPVARLIGVPGEGFKIAMATLDLFRPTVGAAAMGFARRALDETIRHVKSRRVFGAPLAQMQLTQAKIAHMATEIEAGELLVYRAAFEKDSGKPRITREAAMAKWFATEAAGRAADAAVQLFGGAGVTKGEIAERLYRDVRALRIYEGASEIQQLVIARSVLEDRS